MGFIKKDGRKKEEAEAAENQFPEEAELRECRHCRMMISKTAKVCPNCKKRQKMNWAGLILLILLLLACGAGVYYYLAFYSPAHMTVSGEAMESAEPAEDAETGQSVEDVQNAESVQPVEEAQNTESGQPVEEAQNTESGQPVGEAQDAESGQPVGEAQDAESGQSAGTKQEASRSTGAADETAESTTLMPNAVVPIDNPPEFVGTESLELEAGNVSETEKDAQAGNVSEPEKESEPGSEEQSGKDLAESGSESMTERPDEAGKNAADEEGGGPAAAGERETEESRKTGEVRDGMTAGNGVDDGVQKTADDDSAIVIVEAAEVSDYTEEEFRALCRRVDYKKLLRSQETYLNAAVTEELTVMEQVDGGLFDENIYYLCRREDGQGITRYYIIRDDREEDDTPILAGDVIQVYGLLFGSCKLPGYLVKAQPVVPAVTMVYFDLLEE